MYYRRGRPARCVAVLDIPELARPTLESLEIKYIMTNVIIGMNVLGYEVS